MAGHKMISLLAVGLVLVASLHLSVAQIGVVYGTDATKLPTPQEAVALIASNNITRVRLLEPNKDILTALKGKNIEVFLGFPNKNMTKPVTQEFAYHWVAVNVKPYVPDVKIKYIVVGNHVSGNNENSFTSFAARDAMLNIAKALGTQGIKDIKITTLCDKTIYVQMGAYPTPSTVKAIGGSDVTLDNVNGTGLLQYLSETKTPIMVNLFPYHEVIIHPNAVTPEFALFTATGNVVTDGKMGYQNMFDVLLDSFYTVFEKLGYPDIEIIVGETGWSSAGGSHATIKNAQTYLTNLVQHLNKGTPKRSNKPIQVFLDLLDEDKIDHAEIDKHLGLFTADGKIKFPVSFSPSA